MKRFLLLLPMLVAVIAFSLAGGCSSDDSPTEPTNEGGLDNTGKAFIDSLADEYGFGSLEMTMSLAGALIDSLWPTFFNSPERPGMPVQLAAGDDSVVFGDNFTHTYSGGWHVFSYTATVTDADDGTTIQIVSDDSVQFLAGMTPLQNPDSSVTAINARNHSALVIGDSIAWGKVHHAMNIAADFDAIDPTLTLNGSGNDTLQSTAGANGNCDLSLTNSVSMTNVIFATGDAADDCPTSGSMTMSFGIDMSCTGIETSIDTLNINGGWTIAATYANGIETISFNDGTTSWSRTQECGGAPGGGGDFGGDSSFVSDFFAGEDLMENIFKSFDVSFALLEDTVMFSGTSRLPNAGFAAEDGHDSLIVGNYTYNYTNDGWHTFDFSATVISEWWFENTQYADTTDIYGTDSVKTLVDGQPVQFPVMDYLSGITVHAHINWAGRNRADSGVFHQTVAAVINSSNPPDTIVTFNGTANDTIWESTGWESGECEVYAAINQSITNLTMNMTDTTGDCPLSGTMSVAATIDAFCLSTGQQGTDSLSVNGTWTVNATVNNDNTITVIYNDGTTSWTATGPCDNGSVVAGPDRSPWIGF